MCVCVCGWGKELLLDLVTNPEAITVTQMAASQRVINSKRGTY